MIKAIMFDLDDTLLWDHKSVEEAFKATCQLAFEKYKLDPAELEAAVRMEARKLYQSYETYSFTQMIGINPFEGLWGDFLDDTDDFNQLAKLVPLYRKEAWTRGLGKLGIHDTDFGEELAERFPIERRKYPYIYEDAIEVLESLKGKYSLLLLTNGSPDLQKTKLKMTPELVPFFDHVLISGAFGKGKPDESIFEHAVELLNVNKEEVIMVGDNLNTDILGAEKAGIKSVWVNRHHQTCDAVIPTFEIEKLTDLLLLLDKIS